VPPPAPSHQVIFPVRIVDRLAVVRGRTLRWCGEPAAEVYVNSEVLAGRYRLTALLGRGGAGEVWRAEDLELGRTVAVKLLRRQASDPLSTADPLRSEARAAARLSHPNVVATYDVGTSGGEVFLVMELVEGRDLAQLLRTDGLPSTEFVADVAVQASRALDAAHAAGIVHRDVKPGNLLLAADRTLKITDFGISEAAVPSPSGRSVLLGTAWYVAPEQVRGEPASPASDRYALGCVLYELLAGTPPFVADAVEGVLRQHLEAEPVPVQVHRPDVSPGLGDLVMRLLAKDPAARPASTAEVLRLLESPAVAGETQVLPMLAAAPPTDDSAPARHRAAGRWPFLRVIAALAAVLVLVIVVALVRDGDPEPSADGSVTPTPAAGKPTSLSTPTPSRATPTPSRAATPSAARTVDAASALGTLSRLLRESSDRGRGGKVARQAARQFDEAAAALAESDDEKAAEKFTEARKRLTEAQADGRWEPTPAITALLSGLSRSLSES